MTKSDRWVVAEGQKPKPAQVILRGKIITREVF